MSALAVIDLGAYRQNLALLRTKVAPAELMVVVKANAYGHGMLEMAAAAVADGVIWLGSLDLTSARRLRAAGIRPGVSIFAWLLGPDENYRSAVNAGIDLGVSTLDQLRQIAHSGSAKPARLHLKIDTGLHRWGATPELWPQLVREAIAFEREGLVEVYAAWTHIAEASNSEDSAAIARFDAAIAVAEALGARFALRHLAASAAGFARPDARFDLVRMGAFAYGISPGDGVTAQDLGLVPVMTLKAFVTGILRQGGRTLAVVPFGSGEGIPADVVNRVAVAIRGIRFPIVRVELDHLLVDVQHASVELGDEVILFGPGDHGELTLQAWGDSLGTIGEEIAVRVGPRVPRDYLGA